MLKVIAKYGVKRATCDSALIDDLVLAYTSNAGSKIMAVQDKWVACVQKVEDRYVYERDKVLLKGTPACLDQAGIDACAPSSTRSSRRDPASLTATATTQRPTL